VVVNHRTGRCGRQMCLPRVQVRIVVPEQRQPIASFQRWKSEGDGCSCGNTCNTEDSALSEVTNLSRVELSHLEISDR